MKQDNEGDRKAGSTRAKDESGQMGMEMGLHKMSTMSGQRSKDAGTCGVGRQAWVWLGFSGIVGSLACGGRFRGHNGHSPYSVCRHLPFR